MKNFSIVRIQTRSTINVPENTHVTFRCVLYDLPYLNVLFYLFAVKFYVKIVFFSTESISVGTTI
jgi:hypothetical protein